MFSFDGSLQIIPCHPKPGLQHMYLHLWANFYVCGQCFPPASFTCIGDSFSLRYYLKKYLASTCNSFACYTCYMISALRHSNADPYRRAGGRHQHALCPKSERSPNKNQPDTAPGLKASPNYWSLIAFLTKRTLVLPPNYTIIRWLIWFVLSVYAQEENNTQDLGKSGKVPAIL